MKKSIVFLILTILLFTSSTFADEEFSSTDLLAFNSGFFDLLSESDLKKMVRTVEFSPALSSKDVATNINNYLTSGSEEDKDDRERIVRDLIRKDLDAFSVLIGEDYDQAQAVLSSGEDCKRKFSNLFCLFNRETNAQKEFIKSYEQRVYDILNRDCPSSISPSQCVQEKDRDVRKESFRYAAQLLGITCQDECTKEEIEAALEQQTCTDSDCDIRKDLAQDILDIQFRNEIIETSLIYDAFIAILQPDPLARDAAKLFGFEADYTQLPSFIRDDFGSQMCIAKIEGYLDKTVSDVNGVTQYDITNTSKSIQVIADLRGQRTSITPDNTTTISYSYFLRAPEDFGLQYLLAVSYEQNGNSVEVPVTPLLNVSAEDIAHDFETINLPLNTSEGVNEESFIISLLAVEEGTQDIFVHLTYPLLLITAGDSFFDGNDGTVENSIGNGQATQTQGGSTVENSQESLLALMFG